MEKKTYIERVSADRFLPWKNKRPILGHLDIEITERCNNNCIHCYINRPAGDARAIKRELSGDQWKHILKEAADLGCLRVHVTGGEPLLREDFEDLYVFARRLGLKVLLSTNATLINRRVAALFRRIPPLEKIDITLYGMKRGSYEAISRVPGSFRAAMRGIGLLIDHGVPFTVKGIFLPPTEPEVEVFESWTATLPGMDEPPSYVLFLDLDAWGKKGRGRTLGKLRIAPEKGIAFLMRRPEDYMKDRREFCSRFMVPPGEKIFSCGAGIGSGAVNAYGGFQPCLQLRHPGTVFDLRKGSLEEAVKKFFPLLRKQKAENPEYLERCARCFLKGLCDQCPAKSWMEHGVLDRPVDYLCEIAHLEARSLGLLAEGEKAWEVQDQGRRLALLRRRFGEIRNPL